MPIPTSNLVLDLDADAITPQTDDTDLTTWSDQSGNGNDVTQSTAANKPHYRTSRVNLNSKPCVHADDSNDAYTGGTALQFSGNSGLTIIAVVEQSDESTANNCCIIARDASGDRGWNLAIENDGGRVAWIISASATTRVRRDGDLVDCRLLPCVITARYNGSTGEQSIRINGVDDNGAIDGSVPATIGGNGATLQVMNNGFGEPFGGRIARILVYDAALSDGDRDDAESTLMTEYDLSGFTEEGSSPDVNSHQGYTTDDEYHYTVDTGTIYKRDIVAWSVAAQNSSPMSGLSPADHLGDPAFYNDRLYIPIEQFNNCGDFGTQYIGVYLVSDLSRESATDISAQGHECSSIAIDSGNNRLYISSWCDPSELYIYNLTTLAFIGTLTLVSETTIIKIQGITYHAGNDKLYINGAEGSSASTAGLLFEVDPSTGVTKPIWHVTRHASGIIPEGMQIIGGGIRWLFDEGTDEKVYTYSSPRLGAFAPGPFVVTNFIAEILADDSPQFRTSLTTGEVLIDNNPQFRSSDFGGELLLDNNPQFRQSMFFAEALLDLNPKLQMTQEQVEVVGKFSVILDFEHLQDPKHFLWPQWEAVSYGERWTHN